MEIPKMLPQQPPIKVMVGPLNDLKPLNVTVVQAEPSQLQADAYITVESLDHDEALQRDFEHATIIEKRGLHRHNVVAIQRSEGNRYLGTYINNSGLVEFFTGDMDSLSIDPCNEAALLDTLRIAGDDGARSAVIDGEACFAKRFIPPHSAALIESSPVLSRILSDEFSYHRVISTVISGVKSYAKRINAGQVELPVGDIVLAMGDEMYAVWGHGRKMYIQGMRTRWRS